MAINIRMTPIQYDDSEASFFQNAAYSVGSIGVYNGFTTTAATINLSAESVNSRWHMVSHADAVQSASVWNYYMSPRYSDKTSPIKVEVQWSTVGTGNATLMGGLIRPSISGATSSTYSLYENFESGSFSTWTVVNNATNKWVVGLTAGNNNVAQSNSGRFSAYISNNNGLSASYTVTSAAAVSHFYRDVTFGPSSSLSFNWKCWGENSTSGVSSYDYGAVIIVAATSTPVVNTEISTAIAATATGGLGRIGGATNSGKFNVAYGGATTSWHTEVIDLSNYSGLTRRLVFSWINDTSIGVDPPMCIDNIALTGINTVVGGLGGESTTEYRTFATYSSAGTDIINTTTFTFTDTATITANTPLSFVLVRAGATTSDTMTGIVRVTGIKWRYNINQLGLIDL